MNPRQDKKCHFQVETLEGRIALSSGVATSGLEGVRTVPAVVAPKAAEASKPTLRLGSRGEAVKELQRDLVRLGYNIGRTGVDGIFGPNTQGAVIAFQRGHPPLAVDGIVGPQTWAALGRATPPGDPQPIPPGHQDPGHLAIAEARKWLNNREGPGNQNRFSTYFHRGPELWCADFVSYCFEKTGNPIGKSGAGISLVTAMDAWFRHRGDWDSRPEVGAVIAFRWSTGQHHVGIVTKVTGSQITYISGNTSAPGGGRDGVFEHDIPRGSSSIIGYGHR